MTNRTRDRVRALGATMLASTLALGVIAGCESDQSGDDMGSTTRAAQSRMDTRGGSIEDNLWIDDVGQYVGYSTDDAWYIAPLGSEEAAMLQRGEILDAVVTSDVELYGKPVKASSKSALDRFLTYQQRPDAIRPGTVMAGESGM